MKLKILLSVILFLFNFKSHAFCFEEAGSKYQIDPLLLRAIAMQESGLKAKAINKNKKNGIVVSVDYGVMQVNSIHIPELVRLGAINNKNDLLNNPCLNVQIGAWILAKHLRKCGVNWECLGSYNAGFSTKNKSIRLDYARKVYRKYLNTRALRD
ncbi:lytic transglycosylase domain-containing protein [Morganella psychrotolerans]|uniref:lytic transglycosylase domain-containing protein n=1 Tax=Morganella psychrotolerans TaxID=368603 RepID=UPI0039AEEE62